ncbi:glucose PTS transporter subunit IIA [Actinomyces ruminis]|uniref:glucose PTS transporter subunit IIA n=1 Tax=Actinomyces ruminis TaxID=1937003 RepID=UPI0030B8328B
MSSSSAPERALAAPVSGKVIALADVPDPVFSSGALGEGFGVVPSAGDVVAPAAGTVTMVAETGHAVGIATAEGLEVLLHLGVDTVELEGRPFRLTVGVGQEVQAGQSLGAMDLAAITAAGKDTTTIVAVTNSAKTLAELRVTEGETQAGASVAGAVLKTASGDSAVADASAPAPDDGLTGFDATARDIIAGVGGADNIRSVIHCITRVRFYLKDESRADDAAVTGAEGVIDVAARVASIRWSSVPPSVTCTTPSSSRCRAWPRGPTRRRPRRRRRGPPRPSAGSSMDSPR